MQSSLCTPIPACFHLHILKMFFILVAISTLLESMCLFLAAVPLAPQYISIESLSSASLRVQWPLLATVTAEHETILLYTITCSAQDGTGAQHIKSVNRSITQFDMTALEPSTTYNCCVSAENIAGNRTAVCGEGTTLEDGKGQSTDTCALCMVTKHVGNTWRRNVTESLHVTNILLANGTLMCMYRGFV